MKFEDLKYIAIEGVIGLGKTTLASQLASDFSAKLVLEDFAANPFLTEFYKDKGKFAFQTQMFFLVDRYKNHQDLYLQQDLFTPMVIADYMFEKDRIFANLTLDDNELSLYNRVADVFEEKITKPDYVIYLQTSTNVLLDRIKRRGRDFEKNMDEEYIHSLNNAYNHYFVHYDSSPLLILDTSDLDFVKNQHDMDLVINEIKDVEAGTRFVKPLGYDTLRLSLD